MRETIQESFDYSAVIQTYWLIIFGSRWHGPSLLFFILWASWTIWISLKLLVFAALYLVYTGGFRLNFEDSNLSVCNELFHTLNCAFRSLMISLNLILCESLQVSLLRYQAYSFSEIFFGILEIASKILVKLKTDIYFFEWLWWDVNEVLVQIYQHLNIKKN